jgi:hypothetical protein
MVLRNLAALWDLADGRSRVRVYCDNCADEEYMLNFTSFPSLFGGGRRTWDYARAMESSSVITSDFGLLFMRLVP